MHLEQPSAPQDSPQISLARLVEMLGPDWNEGPGPLYAKLGAALRSIVETGFLASGTRLPPERDLAKQLFISRSTVVSAYSVLRDEGVVASRQGSGTWVHNRRQGTFSDEAALSALVQSSYLSSFIDPSPAPIDLTVPMPVAALESIVGMMLPGELGRDLLREATPVGYQPLGLPSLRRQIARYLEARGLPTDEEDLLITSGAQQAISLLLNLFVRPNDAVIVENPTYRGLVDALTPSHARPVTLPIEDANLPGRLRELIDADAPRLIFITPTCHYPTGLTVPEHQRRSLVEVAARASVPIVEDTVNADLSLERPPPYLATYADGLTPVILVGSASKIVWGGLRVGWIRASSPLISRLARLKALSDMGTSLLSQIVVRELLGNLDAILTTQRNELRDSLELMEDTLNAHLPDWRWRRPHGGRSMWIRLPRGDARHFAQFALMSGVAVTAGDTLSVDGSFADHLRLPFVYPPEIIREACQRLSHAWMAYSESLIRGE
ncbi:aminotransferase-like domain-containing protein [Capillimicrobium parvum]|uniref:HTH-type transcriptional regulator NorG n=1 Tax=Capillimicrobium parvum TaxID=2884022 RepID=A0A9E7C1F2_9ACTN|nr:PLP-dependent aminotransferase family protein [Capillimicrobium parvum]UGS36537.1 HTH-type transcriptional regulator NorG [Capillimicrobium parvum]